MSKQIRSIRRRKNTKSIKLVLLFRKGKFTNCYVRILYMDERFRCLSASQTNLYTTKNGINIESQYSPSFYLYNSSISLGGYDKTEEKISLSLNIKNANNINKANDVINFLKKELTDWARNWEGWKNPPIKQDLYIKPTDLKRNEVIVIIK
jgi:hypothetical protein